MNIKHRLRIGVIFSISLFLIFGCQSSPDQTQDTPKPDENTQEQEAETPQEQAVPEEGNSEQGEEQADDQPAKDKETIAKEEIEKVGRAAGVRKQQERAYVKHLVNTARGQIADHKYEEARKFLDQALEMDPVNQEARDMRFTVGRILGERYAQESDLQKLYEDEIQVKIEQAKLEAQNHHKNGMDALKEKNYDHAIHEFERTLEIIKWAPYELGLDSLRVQAETQIKKVRDTKDQWLSQQRAKKMEEARKMAEKLEAEEQARRESKIRLLLSQASDYYTRKRYDKAEQMVDQVMKLDPANKIAVKLRDDIRDAYHAFISDKTLERRIEGWKRFQEDIKESSIPYSQLIIFPERDYWEEVVKKRESKKLGLSPDEEEIQETKAIGKIKKKLTSSKVTWDFSDTPFQEVITVIRYQDDINIVVDPKVIENFELQGIKVTLQLEDVSLQDALNILLDLFKLTYIYRNDVLFITEANSDLAKKKIYPQLHDIRDLTGQVKDFPGPRIELARTTAGQGNSGALFTEEEEEGEPTITSEKLIELIRSSIAPETWDDESGQYSIAETSGQLLVVHEEKVQLQVHEFLNDLRSFSGTMVTIETRFLEVTDDFLEQVGVDWRGVGENNLNTTVPNRAVMPGLTAGDEDNAAGATGSPPYDNNNISASPAAGLFFQNNQISGNGNGRDNNYMEDIRVRSEHIDEGTLGNRLKATGGLALQIATLDDIQLSAVLWLVKKTGRGELLMAPRLTAFNTQRANITVVEQRAYVRDFDVQVAQSAYIADPVIGTIQTGVVLDVRPIISDDLRYITLELRPTIASLTNIRQFTTELGGRGRTVTFEVPEIRLQSIESTVRIPDQGSLMMGGLKTFREIDRKLDIPVLGNIPIVSFFFSQRLKVDEKQNLVILVTAKIIDLSEEERKAYGTD